MSPCDWCSLCIMANKKPKYTKIVRVSPNSWIAFMASACRKRRLVSSLDGEILERLSMKLNPRMLLKDYQSLAGKLRYTYEYIRNFARERDPTLALLQHWWSSQRGKEKTVTVLMELLSDMERDDCVELLRPHEFYSKCTDSWCQVFIRRATN